MEQEELCIPTEGDARKAMTSINAYMENWDARSQQNPNQSPLITYPTPLQGRKVRCLSCLVATPSRHPAHTLWLAEFQGLPLISDMLFQIDETGAVWQADTYFFSPRRLSPENKVETHE